MSVSVGIVAYNTKIDTVRQAIISLKKSNIPINICVLCNSPDPAYQAALRVLSEDLCFSLMPHRSNNGFGAGHNEIVRSIETDWYICCNPDVEVTSTTVSNLLAFAEAKYNVGLLMPKVLSRDGSIQPLARRHPTILNWAHRQIWRVFPSYFKPYEIEFNYSESQQVGFVTGCFFAVRTSVFREIEGFDESFFLYAEDADLSRRIEVIHPNYYVASAEIVHEWGAAWKKSFRGAWCNFTGLWRYFCKHGFLLCKSRW